MLFNAMRPIILNGIDDVVTRPDLADRAVILTLEPIPDEKRRPEKELLAAFEQALPGILGALMDVVAHGLRNLPHAHLEKMPRMADFALWGVSCEGAIWKPGTFMAAYEGNRNNAVDNVIDASPVASAVRILMENAPKWTGTATELLKALGEKVDDATRQSKAWPKTPAALSGPLRRSATFLRKTGIDVNVGDRDKDRKRTRIITICKVSDSTGNSSSAPSVSSSTQKNINGFRGL